MLRSIFQLLKMEPESMTGASGGSPAAPSSPASPAAPAGGGDSPASPPSPPAAPASPSATSPASPAQAGFPENWHDLLPDDLKGDPSIKLMRDIPSLAKSYLHAQKSIGADKVVLPGKTANDEDWRKFFQKAGLPEKFEDYAVKPKEGVALDEAFIGKFKEMAFKNGIVPKHAQGMLDWYADSVKGLQESAAASIQTLRDNNIKALKSEWGDAFAKHDAAAAIAIKEFGGPELQKFLVDNNLNTHPMLVKAFASIGLALKEDQIKGHFEGGGADILTPAQATDKINSILGDPKGPYYDKNHSEHKAVMDEVSKLFAIKSKAS